MSGPLLNLLAHLPHKLGGAYIGRKILQIIPITPFVFWEGYTLNDVLAAQISIGSFLKGVPRKQIIVEVLGPKRAYQPEILLFQPIELKFCMMTL